MKLWLLVVLAALAAAPALAEPTRAELIDAKYGTSKEALGFRNNIPRIGSIYNAKYGKKDFEANIDYGLSIAALVVPGLLFAILTLFVIIFFCAGRLCCNCCGGRKATQQYDPVKTRKFLIAALVIACCLLAIGAAGLAVNEKFHKDSSGSSGFRPSVLNMIRAGSKLIATFKAPLLTILNSVPTINTTVSNTLDEATPQLDDAFGELTTKLNDLSSFISGFNFTVAGTTYPCEYCKTAGASINSATNEIDTKSASTITSLKDALDQTKQKFVESLDDLVKQTNDVFKNGVDAAVKQLDNADVNFRTFDEEQIGKYERYRWLATLLLWLIPMALAVIMGVGYVLKHGWPFSIGYYFAFLSMFVIWLLFAIHLPGTALIGDACVYVDKVQRNVADYIGSCSTAVNSTDVCTADIIDACLIRRNLLDALKMRDKIEFRSKIKNAITDDARASPDKWLNFSQMTDTINQVQSFSPLTFGLDESILNSYLQTINTVTSPTTYVGANVSLLDPTAYPGNPGLNSTKTAAVNLYDAISNATDFSTRAKAKVADILLVYQDKKTQLSNTQTRVLDIEVQMKPVFDAIDLADSTFYCDSIGDAYGGIKASLCSNMLYDIGVQCTLLFVVGVVLIPTIVIMVKLAKRILPENAMDAKSDALELDAAGPVAGSEAYAPVGGGMPLESVAMQDMGYAPMPPTNAGMAQSQPVQRRAWGDDEEGNHAGAPGVDPSAPAPVGTYYSEPTGKN